MRRLKEEPDPSDESPVASPFPFKRAYVIGLVLFINGVSQNMAIPLGPAMTAHFFPELSEEELGFEAGNLHSTFFFGAFFGSLAWGWASDTLGRRPCLLAGICGTLGSVMLFGFSRSFGMACLARFMWGALNGNIGVAKTYMSEICDDSTQARGMALIAAQGGFGRLVGPALGGLLAEPAAQYAAFRHVAVLIRFPYALPCTVASLLALVGLVGAACWLEETLPPERRPASVRHALGAACRRAWRAAGACGRAAPRPSSFERIGESAAGGGEGGGGEGGETAATPAPRVCDGGLRGAALPTLLYCLTGAYQMGLMATTPLWLVTDVAHGGFGKFSTSEIGGLFAAIGPVQIFATSCCFPRLTRRLGYRRTFVATICVSAAMASLTPLASQLLAGRATRVQIYFALWLLQVAPRARARARPCPRPCPPVPARARPCPPVPARAPPLTSADLC